MPEPAQPRVAIVMGSDSDWKTLQDAAAVLREFEIPCVVRVLSAHRTPAEAMAFATQAEASGIQVIIAGAGMAAHLAGAMAAHSVLPVIGVPCLSGSLGGLDALLATVQMPPGVPVATVGVGGAKNAGLLAVQILGVADGGLRARFAGYKRAMAEECRAKDAQLQASLTGSEDEA